MEYLAEEHTSTILAIVPSKEARDAISKWSSQELDPDELHVTLIYLGHPSESDVDIIKEAVSTVCAESPKMRCKTQGLGVFDHIDDDGGGQPVYVSVDAVGLAKLRTALVEGIERAGVDIEHTYDFTPHMTLSYMDPSDFDFNDGSPGVEWDCDEVVIMTNNEPIPFKLGGKVSVKMADVNIVDEPVSDSSEQLSMPSEYPAGGMVNAPKSLHPETKDLKNAPVGGPTHDRTADILPRVPRERVTSVTTRLLSKALKYVTDYLQNEFSKLDGVKVERAKYEFSPGIGRSTLKIIPINVPSGGMVKVDEQGNASPAISFDNQKMNEALMHGKFAESYLDVDGELFRISGRYNTHQNAYIALIEVESFNKNWLTSLNFAWPDSNGPIDISEFHAVAPGFAQLLVPYLPINHAIYSINDDLTDVNLFEFSVASRKLIYSLRSLLPPHVKSNVQDDFGSRWLILPHDEFYEIDGVQLIDIIEVRLSEQNGGISVTCNNKLRDGASGFRFNMRHDVIPKAVLEEAKSKLPNIFNSVIIKPIAKASVGPTRSDKAYNYYIERFGNEFGNDTQSVPDLTDDQILASLDIIKGDTTPQFAKELVRRIRDRFQKLQDQSMPNAQPETKMVGGPTHDRTAVSQNILETVFEIDRAYSKMGLSSGKLEDVYNGYGPSIIARHIMMRMGGLAGWPPNFRPYSYGAMVSFSLPNNFVDPNSNTRADNSLKSTLSIYNISVENQDQHTLVRVDHHYGARTLSLAHDIMYNAQMQHKQLTSELLGEMEEYIKQAYPSIEDIYKFADYASGHFKSMGNPTRPSDHEASDVKRLVTDILDAHDEFVELSDLREIVEAEFGPVDSDTGFDWEEVYKTWMGYYRFNRKKEYNELDVSDLGMYRESHKTAGGFGVSMKDLLSTDDIIQNVPTVDNMHSQTQVDENKSEDVDVKLGDVEAPYSNNPGPMSTRFDDKEPITKGASVESVLEQLGDLHVSVLDLCSTIESDSSNLAAPGVDQTAVRSNVSAGIKSLKNNVEYIASVVNSGTISQDQAQGVYRQLILTLRPMFGLVSMLGAAFTVSGNQNIAQRVELTKGAISSALQAVQEEAKLSTSALQSTPVTFELIESSIQRVQMLSEDISNTLDVIRNEFGDNRIIGKCEAIAGQIDTLIVPYTDFESCLDARGDAVTVTEDGGVPVRAPQVASPKLDLLNQIDNALFGTGFITLPDLVQDLESAIAGMPANIRSEPEGIELKAIMSKLRTMPLRISNYIDTVLRNANYRQTRVSMKDLDKESVALPDGAVDENKYEDDLFRQDQSIVRDPETSGPIYGK